MDTEGILYFLTCFAHNLNVVFRNLGLTLDIDYNLIFDPKNDPPQLEIMTSELVTIESRDENVISLGINIYTKNIFSFKTFFETILCDIAAAISSSEKVEFSSHKHESLGDFYPEHSTKWESVFTLLVVSWRSAPIHRGLHIFNLRHDFDVRSIVDVTAKVRLSEINEISC